MAIRNVFTQTCHTVARMALATAVISALTGCGSFLEGLLKVSSKSANSEKPNSAIISIDQPFVTITEGASLQLIAKLSAKQSTDTDVSIVIEKIGGSSQSRFSSVPFGVTIPKGQREASFTLVSANDNIYEGTEQFTITLVSSNPAILVFNGITNLTLLDDDSPPTLAINDVTSVGESGNLNFSVTLTGNTVFSTTVDFATSSGTATSGTDFTATTGTLTFPAGTTTRSISVPILTDTLYEGNETFNVTLSNPTKATLSDSQAVGTITDDDPMPSVQFSVASQSVLESAGTATVTVNLSAASGLATTIPFAITGTASGAGVDYNTPTSPVTIAAGQTSASISIGIIDDMSSEASETVILTIGSPTNATASGNTVHTLTITDNDTPLDVTVNTASGQATPVNALPIDFSVAFSVAINPATFTTADVTQSGTASGITWSIINSGDDIHFNLRATAAGEGTLIPSIGAATLTSAGGVGNSASTSTANTVLYDTTAPAPPASLNDGTTGYTLSRTPTLSWPAGSDGGSGIADYEVEIGTTSNTGNVLTWTSVGNVTTKVLTGLSLSNATTYYASIRAVDGAGNRSAAVNGDGWTVQYCSPSSQVLTGSGSVQSFVVPAGCSYIYAKSWGAGGGGGGNNGAVLGGTGGGGGYTSAGIPVTPGETLSVQVGLAGSAGTNSGGAGGTGGGGNGGAGGGGNGRGGGGGGASSFIKRGATALVYAAGGGGGGGASNEAGASGGAGGDLSFGQAGYSPTCASNLPGSAGQPGLASAGGTAGTSPGGNGSGTAGSLATGGAAGGNTNFGDWAGGGGGGAGYYGGGGAGGATNFCGSSGGGGGSAYADSGSTAAGIALAGSGQTPANNSDSDYASTAATGGAAATVGKNGRVVLHWGFYLDRVSPNSGPAGTLISIYGSGFYEGTTVTLGGVPCNTIQIVSYAELTCSVPTGLSGAVTVAVDSPGIGSGSLTNGFTSSAVLTYAYSGTSYNYVVPAGVTSILVKVWGAGGGGGGNYSTNNGGKGGGGAFVSGIIPTTPGETLTLYPGARGEAPHSSIIGGRGGVGGGATGGAGGRGGGGAGQAGGGGGALSWIKRGSTYLTIAGAGGGGGGASSSGTGAIGGAGGSTVGRRGTQSASSSSSSIPGTGGTQSAAGTGGVATTGNGSGSAGSTMSGGAGGGLGNFSDWSGGGGGGAGYFGGGGAGGGTDFLGATGGNGGSSYADSTVTQVLKLDGQGQTAANASDTHYTNGVGQGGNAASDGGNGYIVVLPAAVVDRVVPSNGLSGTVMQILGGGFVSGTTVTVGGLACSVFSLVSPSQINCEVPSAASGAVDVTVSVPSTTPITKTGAYTYAATAVFSTATDQPIPFIVPTSVTSITVKAWGAGGGGGGVQGANAGGAGGGGGYVYGVIATTPGETLSLYVGQGGLAGGNNGEFGEAGIGSGGAGGKGGPGGRSPGKGGGGGGAQTWIKRGSTALMIAGAGAGGGGASSSYAGARGGGGGGTTGQSGSSMVCPGPGNVGTGGTAAAGGAGGTCPTGNGAGTAGSLGSGGNGGGTANSWGDWAGGGAGGGGYYGGGGGGGSTNFCGGSGGGGGSSYIAGSVTSGVNTGATSSTAANAADSSYTATAGAGGASATSGNPGLIVISW